MPHAKSEPEEKVEDESAIYNAVNRDLRTVMDKPAAENETAKPVKIDSREASDTNVDVGALAPAGLPKDVTAEELAAIAAAAAQIQMAAAVASEAENSGNGFAQPEAVAAVAQRADGSNAEDNVSATSKIEAASAASTSDAFVGGSEGAERRNGDSYSAEPEDVPVTMAAASQTQVDTSAGGAKADGPRWTAVSVALEADEASMSLDQEMQKAHAALNAGMSVSASQAESPELAPLEAASAVEIARVETPAPMPAEETVISSGEGISQAESVPQQDAELGVVAAVSEVGAVAVREPAVESASSPVAEPSSSYQIISSKQSEGTADAAAAQPEPAEQHFENFVPAGTVTENQEPISSTATAEASMSDASNSETQPAPEAGAATTDSAAAGFAPIASAPETGLDHETVKTTAAAWASWRQIRDTSKGGETSADPENFQARDSAPEDTIAKAVAAGAEQIDQAEAASQNPSDVASIVDSVLADLRPKLMAEISRKMSEKK
jgi:hypothetical protein